MRTLTLPIKIVLVAIGLALVVVPATHAVEFTEIARFNVDSTATDLGNPEPQDIGTNPIAVAWNGTKLYVAGYNGTGDTINNLDVGIVEITNATATGIVDTPSFGSAFGIISTPTFRAYSGLDLSADGLSLAATHDNGPSESNAQGIQVFNTSDNSQRWAFDARTMTGPAFDPGSPSDDMGAGVATSASSSGRRHLYDTTTGAELFGPTGGVSPPGFIWSSQQGGFLPRDMDFDPETGDIYVRHNNRLTKATRVFENEVSDQTILVDPYGDPSAMTGDNFLAQNLSFLSNVQDGDVVQDLIIYNEKDSNVTDQPFAEVVKVIDNTGVEQVANFSLLSGGFLPDAGATYDFDFDPVSQTLALLDFASLNVHIFSVGATSQPADLNGDGFVDGLDLGILLGNFDQVASSSGGELNGTDPVDGLDLGILLGAWNPPASLANAVSVPEPSALILVTVGTSLALAARRRALENAF